MLYLNLLFIICLLPFLQVKAVSLWSSTETHNGTGKFLGPGAFNGEQDLFEMELKNISFTSQTELLVPFYNDNESLKITCADLVFDNDIDGHLSDGSTINENVDMCLANIADTDMLVGVSGDGPLQGQVHFMLLDNREILVAMDITLDLGTDDNGLIKIPYYGSTKKVMIPYSIQTQLKLSGGKDSAGNHLSGTWLEGRLGDFDEDGWLDGTLVSAGNIPLDSPVFPGQPYAMVRHFEMDIPYGGYVLGNVEEAFLRNNKRSNLLINK